MIHGLQKRCREMLQREEALREVAEIIGVEGLQDADRLLMKTAESVRLEFLCQNAYNENDAFSPPAQTVLKIGEMIDGYDRMAAGLEAGALLDEVVKG